MGRARSDPWPQATKQEALDLAARDGFVVASRATSVPAATIRKWAQRAKSAAGADLVEVMDGMDWGQRRTLLVQAYGQRAQQAAQKAGEALDKGKTSDARNCAIVSGIYTDKFLLLGGQATTRSESYS